MFAVIGLNDTVIMGVTKVARKYRNHVIGHWDYKWSYEKHQNLFRGRFGNGPWTEWMLRRELRDWFIAQMKAQSK